MRVLLSGIVGAAVAATLWLAIEHYTQLNLGWLACLVGVITGLAVRKASSAKAGGGSLRGALAIILTLAAIVGGRLGYVEVMQATTDPNSPAGLVEAALEVGEPSEGEEEAAEPVKPTVELSDTPTAPEPVAAIGQIGKGASLKSTFSELDMLWLSLAGLAAYVIGKGGGSSEPKEVAEADTNAESPEDE